MTEKIKGPISVELPSSKTSITLPIGDLSVLDKRVESIKDRAQLSVIRHDSIIVITAICDSLEQKIWEYERSIDFLFNENIKLQEKKSSKPLIVQSMLFFLGGVLLTIIIKLKS